MPHPARRPMWALLIAVGLGALAGLLAGFSSWVFLESLDAVISFREDRAPWLFWMLPVGAGAIVALVHHFGGRASEGTRLVIAAARGTESGRVPARMAPFVLLGTLAAHLFGASVGREGTAVQMSGSLGDSMATAVRLPESIRRDLLVASVAGGFGAVFGVPLAGTVFAGEVAWRGRRIADAPRVLGGCLVAAATGDWLVGSLGHGHAPRPSFDVDLGPTVLLRFAIAGLAFGAAAWMFRAAVTVVRRVLARVGYPPARAAICGVMIVAAAIIVGRASLSLSLPVADAAIGGDHVSGTAWLSKLTFTAICLGGGLPGGEVTPLFVTGAALGAALATPLAVSQGALASIGFVSVFGAAARCPMAATVLAVELFGSGALLPAAVVSAACLLTRGRSGLYEPHHRPSVGSSPIPPAPSPRIGDGDRTG